MSSVHTKINGSFDFKILFIVSGIHVLAAYGIYFHFSWQGVVAFVFLHTFFMIFGISLGHHRYFCHKNFKAVSWFEKFLGVMALLCFQGGPIFWSAVHRTHHALSEKPGDPHDATRGFFWSHFGWLFYSTPNGFSMVKSRGKVRDLVSNEFLRNLDGLNLQVNLTSLMFLFGACWAFGAIDLFFWIGPIRVVSVWHATWGTNSFAHGARIGRAPSGIKNTPIGDLLAGGEGWHRAHHQYPGRLTHHALLHFDIGYYVLRCLAVMKIVSLPKRATEDFSRAA